MTPAQALAILRAEVAAATPVAQALLAFLGDAELENYRKSAQTTDALMTAKICGRGEGIHSITQRIAPVQETAQPGRFNPAAAEKSR